VTPLLLDASVWLAAFDGDDDQHAAARELLSASAEQTVVLAALDLTLYEVANVAVVRWRTVGEAERLVELIGVACPDTVVPVDEELIRRSAAAAADHDLTVYDAAYVAVAARRGWTLVSGDLRDLVRRGHAITPEAALAA
jgi:predicted nucleic acid-binding protein